jgi:Holliday junction resolvasome RuvABC endonuclease subunit
MYFIGIDPAKKSGYVLLQSVDSKLFVIKVGHINLTISMKTNLDLIRKTILSLKDIVLETAVSIGIEDQFFATNINTLKSLVTTRTLYQVACSDIGWSCELIMPTSWRAVLGFKSRRRADVKKEAKKFVLDLFQLNLSEDASEAVCLAVALWAKEASK